METTISSDHDKTPTMLASQTFDRIIQSIQKSNLNFVLHVSPYSANISLKKSLVTNKSGSVCLPPEVSYDPIAYEELSSLKAKNKELEKALETITDNCEAAYSKIELLEHERDEKTAAYKHTTDILEEKVTTAEAKACKLFEENKSHVEAYKKQIKHLNDEVNTTKKEIIDVKKVIKEKNKDLYRINSKCENLESTVKRVRTENSNLKNVKKKIGRGETLEHRKKAISIIETSSTLECKSLDVSPVNHFLHAAPSFNNNSDSIKPLACPELSSPHTPPGPPPASAAGLSGTSSPAPRPRSIAPPGPNSYTYQSHNCNADEAGIKVADVQVEEPSDKKPNIEGIKQVSKDDDFEKLLESIKNAKLPSDDEQNDDYDAMDYDNYPDYYWQMGYETDDGKYFEPSEEELVSHHSE